MHHLYLMILHYLKNLKFQRYQPIQIYLKILKIHELPAHKALCVFPPLTASGWRYCELLSYLKCEASGAVCLVLR